jgi:predicted methyltransferase
MNHRAALVAFLAFASSCPGARAAATPPVVAAAVGDPGRPAADIARDANRHPAELVAFAGIKPGDSVADFVPGTGYFTRILSRVVGVQGQVYAITPAELAAKMPSMPAGIVALAHEPAYANVKPLVEPTAQTAQGLKLDAVWTSDNYHDIYGFFGAKSASAADASIFAALKPGGVFIVIDHAGLPGSSDTAPTTLHRIDPATVKAQVQAAGFVLEAESPLLQNPADPHTDRVFAPSIKGHTDQFVFKFRKPAR